MKGEVHFEAPGVGHYTIKLDFNALCDLEDDVPGLMDGKAEIKKPSAIRAVFLAGLKANHPDIDVRQAGDIIQSVGLVRAGEIVSEAFAASFPEAAKEGKAGPRKAGAGSGR